jgi:hypothetical protein
MPDEATKAAIAALDQTMLNDMKLTVREAPPVVERKGSYKVGNGSVNIHRFKKN